MLMKKLISVLADPLSLYYNTFMSSGYLSQVWKTAVVAPAYKKGHHVIQLTIVRSHKQAYFVSSWNELLLEK